MDLQPSLCCGKKVSILIVDDDPDNLILMGFQVSQLIGCSVISASDGVTALSMAKAFQPDLILLDMMLPDVDGFEVARRLKQDAQTCKIPLIAVTAMARSQDEEFAIQAGCNSYLRKPYDLENLGAAIQQQLQLAASEEYGVGGKCQKSR